jgi:hypothetical protein
MHESLARYRRTPSSRQRCCMKKLVWLFGVLLVLSFFVPETLSWPVPKPTPVVPDDTTTTETDAEIVKILADADAADKARVVDVYSGLAVVLKRDQTKGPFIATSEQFQKVQDATLKLAIDTPGKYEGLDVAIEKVFFNVFGTLDVVAVTPDINAKLITAAEVVANSAR